MISHLPDPRSSEVAEKAPDDRLELTCYTVARRATLGASQESVWPASIGV